MIANVSTKILIIGICLFVPFLLGVGPLPSWPVVLGALAASFLLGLTFSPVFNSLLPKFHKKKFGWSKPITYSNPDSYIIMLGLICMAIGLGFGVHSLFLVSTINLWSVFGVGLGLGILLNSIFLRRKKQDKNYNV